jgi:hypothetical protein
VKVKEERITKFVKEFTDDVELEKRINSFEEVFMINPSSEK